jgi:hypothetical protein
MPHEQAAENESSLNIVHLFGTTVLANDDRDRVRLTPVLKNWESVYSLSSSLKIETMNWVSVF